MRKEGIGLKKLNTWTAAFLLLLFLPLSSLAQGPISGEPKKGPEQSFSLAIYDIPAAQTNPAWTIPVQAVSPASTPSTSPAPEKFTFKSLTGDFLKDAGEIWSYPLHIRTRDILPIAGLAVLTGILINNDEAIHRTFLDYRMGHAWVKAISPEEATCQGLQFSYGVSPVHAPKHPHDWNAFARRWVQSEGLPEELVVLTEGPSPRNPQTNPRMEIIDLRRSDSMTWSNTTKKK